MDFACMKIGHHTMITYRKWPVGDHQFAQVCRWAAFKIHDMTEKVTSTGSVEV